MEPPYPIVSVEGSAYECGLSHGESAKALIHSNIGYYTGYWERNLAMGRSAVRERAGALEETVAGFNVALLEEIRGVADGADADFGDVLALNGRYELAWASPRQLLGGCTCLGVMPTATRMGCTLLAQNWDYRIGARNWLIVLEVRRAGSPSVVMLTEAGIIGHKGLNSAGLGLAINAMVSDVDRLGDHVPFLLLCREMLSCGGLSDAVGVFLNAGRSVSYNVMLGCEGALLDLEAHPGDVSVMLPESGVLAHTNHFVGPRALPVRDEYAKMEPSTLHRLLVSRERLLRGAGAHTEESLMEILRSHVGYPASVCFHSDPRKGPDGVEETLTSVVMNLEERVMWATRGPPCSAPYTRLSVPSLNSAS